MRDHEYRPVLECQDCGEVVRYLTFGEAQVVARDPYRFVVYCLQCQRQREYEQIGKV